MADFLTIRAAALAVLSSDEPKTRRSGAFLGQCAVDPTPLSVKQKAWFDQLATRAGMAPLFEGGEA